MATLMSCDPAGRCARGAMGLVLFGALVGGPALAQQAIVPPPKSDDRLTKLAREVEPDLVGEIERLPQYVDFIRSRLANDTRLFAFDVQAVPTGGAGVALEGYVEFSQTREGLIRFLERLGFEVSGDGFDTLPDDALGEKRYGFVRTSHTLSYSKPTEPRSVVTDCLLGEPLYLLREVGDHLLVHSGGGYLGYVAAADVYRVPTAAFGRYPSDRCVRMVVDHELESGLVVPAGALLKQISGGQDLVECALPTGEAIELPASVCQPSPLPMARIDNAITVGEQLLGTHVSLGRQDLAWHRLFGASAGRLRHYRSPSAARLQPAVLARATNGNAVAPRPPTPRRYALLFGREWPHPPHGDLSWRRSLSASGDPRRQCSQPESRP